MQHLPEQFGHEVGATATSAAPAAAAACLLACLKEFEITVHTPDSLYLPLSPTLLPPGTIHVEL